MKGKFFPVEMRRKDGGSLLLREAEEGDAGAVLAYLNQVGGESDNLLFGRDEFAMPLEQERQWIASLRKQEKSILLLGICEDELSSVASVSAFDRRERIAHRAEVAVSVKKACWGLGIGRAVMEALIRFVRGQGMEILQLDVRADNGRAIALYESLGFETLGRYRNFLKVQGEYFDAYCMNLYL